MRDVLFDSFAHRVSPRHSYDAPLMRTMRSIASIAAEARNLHKERGPETAAAVIKGELIPKFQSHVRDLKKGLEGTRTDEIRTDYASGYGLHLNYKSVLSTLGRVSDGEWELIERDATRGAA